MQDSYRLKKKISRGSKKFLRSKAILKDLHYFLIYTVQGTLIFNPKKVIELGMKEKGKQRKMKRFYSNKIHNYIIIIAKT